MSIWEAFGMGRHKGFSREAGLLLDEAVELAGSMGCARADTGHLLLAMLQTDRGPAGRFLAGKNITEPAVRRQLAESRTSPARQLDRKALAPDLRRAMDYALIGAQNAHLPKAEPEHLLCAMLEDDGCTAGILLASMGNRVSTVANFFSQFNDIMMEMTTAVMKVAPVGVFCLIAKTFAGIGFDAFVPMLKYMGSVILALALQCFVVYQVLLFLFTRLNPFRFIRKFFPVMTFAFSTSTSNATIPLSIDTLFKKIGVSKRISSFTIPLGATINMDGTSIMQGVAVIFIAQAYGIDLTPSALATVVATATVASIGTAGVPSVGLVTLSMVLTSVGLPTEGIALIMGIDRILDMLRTAVNITGDAVCTTIIAMQQGAFKKEVFDAD